MTHYLQSVLAYIGLIITALMILFVLIITIESIVKSFGNRYGILSIAIIVALAMVLALYFP